MEVHSLLRPTRHLVPASRFELRTAHAGTASPPETTLGLLSSREGAIR